MQQEDVPGLGCIGVGGIVVTDSFPWRAESLQLVSQTTRLVQIAL